MRPPAVATRERAPEATAKLDAGVEGDRGAQTGAAKLANLDSVRSKDAARSPEEWIKRIRTLRAQGKSEEAAKELAAFRAAYKDRAADLLPADLRDARPPTQRP